ncbi:MAG: HAMP domain-containing protein [Clostridia bacterium]|nr:HAMP domain-containing protein [Clostridia bacterium]
MRNNRSESGTVWWRSVHLKLALIMILLVCAVMVAVGEYLLVSVAAYYEEDFREQMYNVFTADTVTTLRESAAGGLQELRDTVSAYSGRLGIGSDGDRDFFLLDGTTGKVLAGGEYQAVGDGAEKTVDFTKNILLALSGEVGSGNRITDTCFDVAVPVSGGGNSFIVYVRDNKQQSTELNRILLSIIVQAVVFGLAVSVLLSVILSKTLTRPIEALTRGARRVSRGEFDQELPVYASDEIGGLTETFNEMSHALEQSVEALGAERNRYSSLLLHMTDGVLSFDRDGRCQHINPAAREMLGITEEADTDYATLFGEGGIPLSDILALPGGAHRTATLERGDSILEVILSRGGRGFELSAIAVVHDITQEQHLEEARRKFIADVSHELRTPLTNIKGYAETLDGDDNMPPHLRHRFLGVVQNEADRMLRIVKDLLTLSRMDNRSMSWHFEWVDMENLLENINTAMQIRAGEKHHTLSMVLQGTLPMVWCDKERIEQVIVNLLSNAVNYTPEGGSLQLIAGREEDRITISVRDNGIGIPEKDLPHLFDRFYRVDKARSRESGGTGLGLAITREIVEKHNGSIRVESRVGEGTLFVVTLPVDSGIGRAAEEAGV